MKIIGKEIIKGCSIFTFAILIVLVIFFVIIFTVSWRTTSAELTLINATNMEIVEGLVKLGSQSNNHLFRLGIDESKIFHFENFSDDHYDLKIRFQNNTNIDESFGYVTNGMAFKDTVIIYEDSNKVKIKFNNGKNP